MRINFRRLERRLDELARFGRDPEGGWTRFSFSEAYMHAQSLVRQWMEEAGLKTRLDAAGNLIGRLDGQADAPVIALGSHIDSVRRGGRFDGNLGVIAGLEAVDALVGSGVQRAYPVELIVFIEEEGGRFGGAMVGSACLAGLLEPEKLPDLRDDSGLSMWDAYLAAGFDPARMPECRAPRGYYRCYLEMHVEQGIVLERHGKTLGLVQGIAGPHWFKAAIEGTANHAGATPMDMRRDALAAAALVISATEGIGRETMGRIVATVGGLTVAPNVTNVIPGRVELGFDVRGLDAALRENAVAAIIRRLEEVCRERGLDWLIKDMIAADPVVVPESMRALIGAAADEEGVSRMDVVSGACHDAQHMAAITDIGMIFVPSKDGRSHCPEEFSAMEHIGPCTAVLARVLRMLQEGACHNPS